MNLFVLILLVLSGGIPREVEAATSVEVVSLAQQGQEQQCRKLHLSLSLQPLVGNLTDAGRDFTFHPMTEALPASSSRYSGPFPRLSDDLATTATKGRPLSGWKAGSVGRAPPASLPAGS